MSVIKQNMPVLARHEGVWEGTYRFITPHLQVVDQYDFHIEVSFPEDGHGGITYRQLSHYTWPDGRTGAIDFEAQYQDRQVVFETDAISGRMWEIDDNTLYLTFGFPDQPGVQVCEMIQLADNNNDRARTWHWFQDGKLFQLTLVDECRIK